MKNRITMLSRGIKILLVFVLLLQGSIIVAQGGLEIMDYRYPEEYIVGNVTVSGVRYLDPNAIIGLSGLQKHMRILVPGEKITNGIEKLWSQGLFSDIKISITEINGDTITLDIFLSERPRISSVEYFGLKKTEKTDIGDKVNLLAGSQVTDHILGNTRKIISDHFIEKGFLDTKIRIVQKEDPDQPNMVILNVHIDKNEKVKISDIYFEGNKQFTDKRLKRIMKNTKKRNLNFFKASKYVIDQFEEDKASLAEFYNENGYRDFTISMDSVYVSEEDRVALLIRLDEGNQYFFGDIDWVGNSIYPKEFLGAKLNINRGDIYNTALLNNNLTDDLDYSVSNLYLDYGYLFSQINPVEKRIEGDSVDIEIRISEGEPAYLNNVIIKGNNRTNEHVVRRELTTLPGDLFSKEKIIRSARQIGVLGHFDPEKINPIPLQNPEAGTVDLEYNLEEQANDQFEISGGWGAGMLVGTVGVRFNNFAMRNFFKGSEWRPYPSGDGQSLSIRAQSNGRVYQSYNLSFSEPWLGGKSPTTFTTSLFRSLMTNGSRKGEEGRQSMIIDGATIGIGKRLEWPDDFFSIYSELSYQRYDLNNYSQYSFLFQNGVSNMLSLTAKVTRFSAGPNLIYPQGGSTFSFSVQATPPYSLGKDYSSASEEEKYKWIEFHKWVFKGDYYYQLFETSKLVLNARVAFGYLGHYNSTIGPSPFENFYVGGDGMTGYSFYGRDVISLRGYENGSLTPTVVSNNRSIPSGNVYQKLTFEIRYPFTLNPQATIFGLVFLEAGKAWYELKDYNPFKLHRSAGVGLRANLPMFGLLGIDYAYGFDAVPGQDVAGHQFHFTMGQQF
ncbi:MAG: outer membrane protein assembly factor BamA [Bacteroidales bacterium]|nr:outer membrane protein assembly factor BamA [Bacteroidales bacterium]